MKLTVPELVTLILAHDMERTRTEELLNEFGSENYQEGKKIASLNTTPSLNENKELVHRNKIALIKLIRAYGEEVVNQRAEDNEYYNGLGFAKSYVEKYFNLQ